MRFIKEKARYLIDSIDQIEYVISIILTRSKVPYIGWVGQDNLGDEVLFNAHLKLFPKLNILYFRKSKVIDYYLSLKLSKLFKIGILGGGTLINQSNYWFEQVEYLQKLNLKMFCIGTGVASSDFFQESSNDWKDQTSKWIHALNKFLFVGVRGPYSQDFLVKNSFKKSVIVGDTALCLAKDTYMKKDKQGIIGINYGVNKSQSVWGKESTYTLEMSKFIKKLIKQGYKVHLLPIFIEDIVSNKKLLKLVNDNNCKLIIRYKTLEEYSHELNKCDVFVGQKLHSTIIACMNRIPAIMIEYNPKCRDFMASMDLEKFVIKTSEFKQEKAEKLLKQLISSYDKIQTQIDKKILYYKKLQYKYAKEIMKCL